MIRSILSIIAGFILIGVLSLGTDAVVVSAMPGAFSPTGRTESVPVLLLTLAYVFVFAVIGCYLTARLAPQNPMKHALVLGVLGLIFSIIGTTLSWNTAPVWYHVTALLMVMPAAWLGGRLREAQLSQVKLA